MILEYKNTSIYYTDVGSGSAIVLLHGFLEDITMWNFIVKPLSKKHRVICIDLLGHGKTNCLGYIHTMPDMANAVKAVLKHLKLRRYTFIGHSMGAYVALAFAKLYLKNVKGICLLNSTYKADDAERKKLRKRANKMIKTNFNNMVRMSFANLFSEKSKKIYKKEFENALNIALKTPLQAYLAANEGMILREDFSSFYAKASFKKQIITGKKDSLINVEEIIKYAKSNTIKTTVLSEGHMSYIENTQECLEAIMRFVEEK